MSPELFISKLGELIGRGEKWRRKEEKFERKYKREKKKIMLKNIRTKEDNFEKKENSN